MSSSNGQRNPFVIDVNNAAVVAKLVVLGVLHEDREALDYLSRRRPDLDLDALRLMAEVTAAVYLDLQDPYRANLALYVRHPK